MSKFRNRPRPLSTDFSENKSYSVTNSGTFTEGDFSINKTGITINNSRSGRQQQGETGDLLLKQLDDEGPLQDLRMQDLQVLETVGQGSSGTVQKAIHIKTGRLLALKKVALNVTEEKVRKQILLELRTLHDSTHCNYIVLFHGAFYMDGNISIALEYMDGGSLADVLKVMGRIPEHVIARIASQVLKGLAYLHKERHLIHRDIKPSNLLVNLKGQVKISDFGVSGQLPSSLPTEQCASWVGTVCYMSPERISGHKYGYDSDIWSFGLSMLELALGRFPYEPVGENKAFGFWDLMDHIVTKPPPQLDSTQFSDEFCDFVSLCLRKSLDERPCASELLVHPFLTKYMLDEFDMAEWVHSAVASCDDPNDVTRIHSKTLQTQIP
mmetsp:Transcript_14673/g.25072  ORF Transcript_14673/g.25072 Transcript_14673/m.25072 type:complete len:382 (+) Transcript_14673:110-1255(+)|eukprot:CAMPEP_0196663818 /NCGR_PEP_ID=MMETSP1086-20130531/54400_1 /TAXON_ID=77921 /ORGANISM="Cyanoptyche  gloeocystis , Strain SAG4.97" /LENGTH=381 /DNA_ID=CAMNT_0041999795 /DNA_START=109 /DNA_END=1254 /DNA_ORIENTATION=-